jgi:hypothetical protein
MVLNVTTERDSSDPTGPRHTKVVMPEQAVRFLQLQSARLYEEIKVPRPWHYAELHNPWARAGAFYDSWGFLELCQSPPLVDAIARLIGEDVILFDSQWLPDPWHPPVSDFESDAHRFPVDPVCGVTALISFANHPSAVTVRLCGQPEPLAQAIERRVCVSLDLPPGHALVVDRLAPYSVQSPRQHGLPTVYAARYFPASSQYNRDPSVPVHRALTERYPLLNYAQMPLWLVHGEDRAQNDFVTGFNVRAGFWTNADW